MWGHSGKRLLLLATLLAAATRALAHGFGERYDLPVPLTMVMFAAAAAVAISFVAAAILTQPGDAPWGYARFDLLRFRLGRALLHPRTVGALQGLSVAMFGLVLVAAFFGDFVSTRNLAPTLIWVIWWVGMGLTVAVLGNLWNITNPWLLLFRAAERLWRRLQGTELARHRAYPARLGRWPAVILFLAFAWIELAFPGASGPRELGWLALLYSAITWVGMFRFGAEEWIHRGELFSVAFGYLARCSLFELVVSEAGPPGGAGARGAFRAGPSTMAGAAGSSDLDCWECFRKAPSAVRHLYLRPPGAGLLAERERSTAGMVFVIALLATVSFDGLVETEAWAALAQRLVGLVSSDRVVATLGMFGSVAALLGAYLLACALSARAPRRAGAVVGTLAVARDHALALIPIALAYHLAHYQAFLLIQGQRIIPLISDPFGAGWDLFGTAGYRIDVGVLGAAVAWAIAVAAVVLGHGVSIYVAHHVALREGRPLGSELPLVGLMIGYTVLSLWILSQPIVA